MVYAKYKVPYLRSDRSKTEFEMVKAEDEEGEDEEGEDEEGEDEEDEDEDEEDEDEEDEDEEDEDVKSENCEFAEMSTFILFFFTKYDEFLYFLNTIQFLS